MRTLAGLAGNQRSSPENGSLPKRRFFAGTACTTIFRRPDSVNSPAPFLCTAPRIVSSSAASTALAAFGSTAARSATCAANEAFVKVSLIGDGALDAFTATFLAATAFFAGTFFAATSFFAATFLVGTGAAAFLATFFAEVGMFLLPVVVSELREALHGMCTLHRRILQALIRFARLFCVSAPRFVARRRL